MVSFVSRNRTETGPLRAEGLYPNQNPTGPYIGIPSERGLRTARVFEADTFQPTPESPQSERANHRNQAQNDRPFSMWEATKSFGKGLLSPLTSLFESPQNFVMGLGMMAVGATLIIATGGAATPFLIAAGVAMGTFQVGQGAYKFATAKNAQEQEEAFYDIGAGTSVIGLSVAGAKGSLEGASQVTGLAAEEIENMNALQGIMENLKASPSAVRESWGMLKNGQARTNLIDFGTTIQGRFAPKTAVAETDVEALPTAPENPMPKQETPTVSRVARPHAPWESSELDITERRVLLEQRGIRSDLKTPEEFTQAQQQRIIEAEAKHERLHGSYMSDREEINVLSRQIGELNRLKKGLPVEEHTAIQQQIDALQAQVKAIKDRGSSTAYYSAKNAIKLAQKDMETPTANGMLLTPEETSVPAVSANKMGTYQPDHWTEAHFQENGQTVSRNAEENAAYHYDKHVIQQGEFRGCRLYPEITDAESYQQAAVHFFEHPPDGTEMKVLENGDVAYYYPEDNIFGVVTQNGTPRTFFRPQGPEIKTAQDAYNFFRGCHKVKYNGSKG